MSKTVKVKKTVRSKVKVSTSKTNIEESSQTKSEFAFTRNIKSMFMFLFEAIRVLPLWMKSITLHPLPLMFAFIKQIFYSIKNIKRIYHLFIISSAASFVIAMMPWITFKITLLDSEVVKISSNFKLLFLFPGFVGIAISLSPFKGRRFIFLSVWMVAFAVYVAGYFYPNPIHTFIKSAMDYKLLSSIYIYGAVLVVSGLTGMIALKESLFPIRDRLISIPLVGESDHDESTLTWTLPKAESENELIKNEHGQTLYKS